MLVSQLLLDRESALEANLVRREVARFWASCWTRLYEYSILPLQCVWKVLHEHTLLSQLGLLGKVAYTWVSSDVIFRLSRALDGPNDQSPVASVRRMQATLAGHFAVPWKEWCTNERQSRDSNRGATISTSGRTTTTTQNDVWCNIQIPLVLSRFCIVKRKEPLDVASDDPPDEALSCCCRAVP